MTHGRIDDGGFLGPSPYSEGQNRMASSHDVRDSAIIESA